MISDQLEPSDIDEAVSELALSAGWDFGETWQAVRERAGGERDPESLALAVAELYVDAQGEGLALPLTENSDQSQDVADKGNALPDGSYPIPDAEHLHAAAVLAASGHGDAEAARRLIRKRAGELGVSLDSLPGFGDDDSGDVAASYYNGPGYQDGHYVGLSAAGSYYPGEAYGYDPAAEAAAAAPEEVLRLAAGHPQFFGAQDVAEGRYMLSADLVPLTHYDSEVSRYVALAAGYSPRDLGMVPLAGGGGDYGAALDSAHAGSEVERLQMDHPHLFMSGKARTHAREGSIHDPDRKPCPTCRRKDCVTDHGQPRRGGRAHPGVRGGIFPRPHGAIGGAESPHGANYSTHPRHT
jgi:hypothetical protein